jgi:transcriptional regulator with XRE-family HTH domain
MEDFNRIREWLVPKLSSLGWSVEKFSRRVGVSRASIYFYLVDKKRPTEEVMGRMCKILGVPIEEGLAQYTPKRMGRKPNLP